MKKAVTFRLKEDLLSAARDCATREHRTLTNFIEVSLRDRIGEAATCARRTPAQGRSAGRTTLGE